LTEKAVLLMLVDRQMFEPVSVSRAREGGPGLRETLAVALGRIGDPRGLDVLVELSVDDTAAVRRAAVFALGELEDRGAARALLRAAGDDDRETGVLAVEALGKLGASVVEVGDALAELPDEERWARLLPPLFRFDEEATVPLAQAGLGVADPELHARAAYALARNPRAEAAPTLRTLLGDPDPWVRGWAARALGRVGGGGDLARLRPLLDGPEPGPIIQTLRAGARLVGEAKAAAPASWRPRLMELLDDSRPGVRGAALEVAGTWLLDEDLGNALVARAEGKAGEPWERGPALTALADGRHPRAEELALAVSREPDPLLRAAAARAAGSLREGELLERLAHDPAARVRIAVLEARLEHAEEPAEVAAAAISDTDPGVRAVLFDWLTEHPVLPVEIFGEAVVTALADRNTESSLAAVRAIRARAEAEPLERGTLVAILERLAESEDYLVRREGVAALEALEREPPPVGTVETGKSLDVYELILQRTARPVTVEVRTARGPFRIRLDCPRAPLTCVSFLSLANQGFYDGLTFHRVVPDFVVQGGDPRGDGYGGPSFTVRDEIGRLRYRRGVVGMALAGPDTGGSQFFITLSPQPHLDGGYTAFGEVAAGEEVLDQIAPHDSIETIVEVDPRTPLPASPARAFPRPATEPAADAEEEPGPPVLVGRVGRAEVERAVPSWVQAEVESAIDPLAAAGLTAVVPGAEVRVYFGTWCSDSKRELSRLWRALDEVGGAVPFAIDYIAVDEAKKEPEELTAGVGLAYVPTLVVRRGGEEVGRIIEESPHGVERDLLALLTGEARGVLSARDDVP
jgi:cyclophilin family peptidyl-prolyl cis-trans isomerase/HEAT repeat protein